MKSLYSATITVALSVLICACVHTSQVMDMGNGVYMVSAHAGTFNGGTTGSNNEAYTAATKFCGERGLHAIVLDASSRDVYHSESFGSFSQTGGAFSGGTHASGNTDMKFKCSR